MKTKSDKSEIRDHYDFRGGVRGKYVDRLREGSKVVVLEPDVAAEFESDAQVNEALRAYVAQRKAGRD